MDALLQADESRRDAYLVIAEAFPEETRTFRKDLDTRLDPADPSAASGPFDRFAAKLIRENRAAAARAPVANLREVVAARKALLETLDRIDPEVCAFHSYADYPLDFVLSSESMRQAERTHLSAMLKAMAAGRRAPVEHPALRDSDYPAMRAAIESTGVGERLSAVAFGGAAPANAAEACAGDAALQGGVLASPDEQLAPWMSAVLKTSAGVRSNAEEVISKLDPGNASLVEAQRRDAPARYERLVDAYIAKVRGAPSELTDQVTLELLRSGRDLAQP